VWLDLSDDLNLFLGATVRFGNWTVILDWNFH